MFLCLTIVPSKTTFKTSLMIDSSLHPCTACEAAPQCEAFTTYTAIDAVVDLLRTFAELSIDAALGPTHSFTLLVTSGNNI